jgi:peptide/nickel transport system permease protein
LGSFIVKRLLLSIPALFVVSILIFGSVRIIPGDICLLILQTEEAVTPEQCDAVYERLGLDQPAVKQYFSWIGGILQGDFGKSMRSQNPVFSEIRHRLDLTFQLSVFSALFAGFLAIPIGVYSALKQNKPQDYALRLITIGWLSMPSFWVATMLVTFPARWWGYSTPIGFSNFWESPGTNLEQLYLPAFALGLALSASLARLTRSSMLEVLRQDYIRTARAKGLTERVVLSKHALKNAMLPVITLFGLQLGTLMGGTIVIESIFALPGLGTLLLSAVTFRDYTIIQGVVMFFAIMIVLINLMVDLSYAWFDPRVRYT